MVSLQDEMVAMQVPLKMANSPHDSLQLSFSRCVELLSLIQTLAKLRDRVLISFRCLRHHCSHAFRLPTCLEQKDSENSWAAQQEAEVRWDLTLVQECLKALSQTKCVFFLANLLYCQRNGNHLRLTAAIVIGCLERSAHNAEVAAA